MKNTEYIYGINPVSEFIKSDKTPEKVYINNKLNNKRIFEILKICRKKKFPVKLISNQKLDTIIKGNHQGIIIERPTKKYSSLDKIFINAQNNHENPFIIATDSIEDPQNLGAIIRTSYCAGAHGFIFPSSNNATLSGGTVKASAGAIEYMDIFRTSSMTNTLKDLKKSNCIIIGLDENSDKSLWDIDLTSPLILIVGGENKSIKPHIKRELTHKCSLPIKGKIGSLNASAAASAAIYEVVRQRQVKN